MLELTNFSMKSHPNDRKVIIITNFTIIMFFAFHKLDILEKMVAITRKFSTKTFKVIMPVNNSDKFVDSTLIFVKRIAIQNLGTHIMLENTEFYSFTRKQDMYFWISFLLLTDYLWNINTSFLIKNIKTFFNHHIFRKCCPAWHPAGMKRSILSSTPVIGVKLYLPFRIRYVLLFIISESN